MQQPIKPERPAIFTLPVKYLSDQAIKDMPALNEEHENALNAYYKALHIYHEFIESQDEKCENQRA